MKHLRWVAVVGVLTACVVLFRNKDDMRRITQMRQMLCG